MDARTAALKVLTGSELGTAKSDELLADQLSGPGLTPLDRALAKELVSGVLRNRGRLDHVLDGSLKRGLGSLTAWERNNLRLGLYQLSALDRIPQSAAVNESVKLAKRFGRRGTIGLTNAVLRDIIRKRSWTKPVDIADSYRRLAVERSHPEWLVKRWIAALGEDQATALLAAGNREAPVTIRPNRSKTTVEGLERSLAESGFEPSRNGLVDTALDIGRPAGLTACPEFRQGLFYIQDAAAQLVGALAAAMAGPLNLDLCCSPGGKLTAIAGAPAAGTLTVGADIGVAKLARVRQNLSRLGITGVPLVCADATRFAARRQFDLVMADVPCSGLGVLRRRLDLRWRIAPEDVPRLAALQAAILDAAAGLVAPGGRLLYSTCTLTPEENELQVESFLRDHQEFRAATPDLPDRFRQGPFLYLWPHRHGADGAFAACLAKRP
ncbi:MAG: 16S rRNA (cytosine(967)-C(5))-methyltransferase RsmB [Candidatus Edwardsbacteria bacterium]|jgi:16S rRNA (cytosine967-C5)-methyltransferase|nr:16S rRNA (cytosine(967)-C(5))-methyltransferase RsmB [Candidatus Edwardsbacteria bacterium]